METTTFQIDQKDAGVRVDKVAASYLDMSRKRIHDMIQNEKIKVNGTPVKGSYTLQAGDVVDIDVPPLESTEIHPEKMDLDIIYEDGSLLVINKPKGLVVHPAPGHYSGTLVNGLMYHCKDLSGINGVMRPGIVHRIDKDTSGLLIVCKNDKAHASISAQLQDKTCHREYLAIVHHPFAHENGTINAPIGRDEKDRQKMAVTAKNSKEAVTRFTVLENFKEYALVRCLLETGRTHQIRVHMQYIGHPVAGDPKYGYRHEPDTKGQLLHAFSIEFNHPETGEKMEFTAPMEPIFSEALETLRKGESL